MQTIVSQPAQVTQIPDDVTEVALLDAFARLGMRVLVEPPSEGCPEWLAEVSTRAGGFVEMHPSRLDAMRAVAGRVPGIAGALATGAPIEAFCCEAIRPHVHCPRCFGLGDDAEVHLVRGVRVCDDDVRATLLALTAGGVR